MASDAWARVDAVLRDNLPLLAEEWPEDIPVLVDAVLLAAGPSEDEARLARERDEARAAAEKLQAVIDVREVFGPWEDLAAAIDRIGEDALVQFLREFYRPGYGGYWVTHSQALAVVRALRGAGEKDDG